MEITKKDFTDISTIIFEQNLTKDVFLLDTFFTIRNVSGYETDKISQKYKYKKNSNFHIMLDVLSLAIIKIGGLEINNSELVRKKLKNSHALVVTFFYHEYTDLIKNINKFLEILEIYIETDESKNNWSIFKNFNNHYDFSNLKTLNIFQKNWILLNLEKDKVEEQKNEWNRTNFMTNAICAFTNGKQYKQNKDALNAMSRYEIYDREIEENKRIAEDTNMFSEVEKEPGSKTSRGKDYVNKDSELFDSLKQKRNETKEECLKRIDTELARRASHEIIDDHDKIVRDESMKKFIVVLFEYRKKQEIARKIREMKREIEGEEDIEILGEEITDKEKSGDFYNNGIDYSPIMNTKGLHFVTRKEKKQLFDEMMEVKIDVDKEVKAYLKKMQEEKFKLKELNENLDSMGFMPLKKE